MTMRAWVKVPSRWIEEGGLQSFQWGREGGSSQTAALMVYIAIAHRSAPEDASAMLSYDMLTAATHLSRTKVADGLDVLEQRDLIERGHAGRSTYQLTGYDPKRGWAMLPARPLYAGNGISAFQDFHLRKKSELDALKAYLAFAARRDTEANRAHITYEQLSAYAAIPERRIKAALSILMHNNLVVVEQSDRKAGEPGVAHAYRLTHLQPRRHAGTTGRAGLPLEDA